MIASSVKGLVENDNTRIHNLRFLGRVSVRTVVIQDSTGEQVSLYRPSSEIYVQKIYLSFRFITSRPLCQIKQGDQTL